MLALRATQTRCGKTKFDVAGVALSIHLATAIDSAVMQGGFNRRRAISWDCRANQAVLRREGINLPRPRRLRRRVFAHQGRHHFVVMPLQMSFLNTSLKM